MDLRHLRYFTAVAGERHMGRAAARLFVAQPALSRQIKDLEDELDVVLLDRNSRGVDLTPAGAALFAAAGRVLQEAGAAVDRARRAAAGLEGRLVIGATRTAMWREFLPRATETLAAELPHVALDVQEMEAGPVQWDSVRTGAVDLAIGTEPPRVSGLKSEPLFDSSLDCALLPASHPLAAHPGIAPVELAWLPLLWAVPELHPVLLAAVVDEIERLGITSTREFSYSGPHAVWLAVAAGRGWSPVARSMTDWAPDGTVAVPVEGLRIPLVNSAIWRADDRSGVLRLVLDVLRRFRDTQRPSRGPRSSGGAARRAETSRTAPGGIPVGLELRHLRAVAALTDGASFGQAATRLGLSQPALSRQIRDLEREVGAVLFERSKAGIEATTAGETLAADAAQVLEAVEDLLAEMVRARRLQAQCVIIGAIEMAEANPSVLALVRRCNERHPGLQIVLREQLAHQLCASLEEGAVDLALGPLGTAEGREETIDSMLFNSDTVDCALVPASHPLARRQQIGKNELASLPFLTVTPQASPDLYARAMSVVASAGIRLGSVLTFEGVQTGWAAIAQGRGWTLGVGRHRTHPPAGCVAVPVDGLSLPWGLELLWRHGERIAAIQQVVGIAGEIAEGHAPRRSRDRGGRAQRSR